MNFKLDFAPYIAWPLLWIFAGLVCAIFAVMLYHRKRGATLRGLTGLILLASLTNPTVQQEERQPLTDIAAVIVDESQSQAIGNRTAQTQNTLADLKKRFAQLGNTELRIAAVKSGLSKDEDGTRLFTALSRLTADIPKDRYAGAILITDGEVHDVPQNLSALQGPVHTLLSGSKSESDRRIVIDSSPHFGIVGQDQTLQFHLEDNAKSSAYVSITVHVAGGVEQKIDVIPGTQNAVKIPIQHAGQNLIELSSPVREGELSTQNNRAVAVIDGIRDRLRVLLVSGQPHPGERTWRNLLKADAAVDLVHFTILRPPEKQDGTPTKELSLIAFPTRELFLDKLDQFDLVIFDRYRRQAILQDSYLANIAAYVRKGGALLVASGPDFADFDGLYSTPMADVLSAAPTGAITETPFKPALTKEGRRHPVTQDLAGANGDNPQWGRWFRLIDTTVAAGAETLMSGPDEKPLLVLNKVGEGRVAQLLSDHGWLWARGYEGGGPQTELLRRMAHWLMQEPDLEEEALSAKQVGGDIVIERRSMADTVSLVTVTSPSGKAVTLKLLSSTPGLFTAHMPAEESGLHSLSDGTLQAAAAIGNGDAKEALEIRSTDQKLAPVAKATGGGIAWIEDGLPTINLSSAEKTFAGSGWMSLRSNGQYRIIAIREISLFTSLLSLAAMLIAASAMWFREGR
jgi:hypothetical protein